MTGSLKRLRSRVRVASFIANDSHPSNLGLTSIRYRINTTGAQHGFLSDPPMGTEPLTFCALVESCL